MLRTRTNPRAFSGALLAGAAAATGFQPLMLWPATLIAVAVLLHLVARAPRASIAALIGWLFGLGYFSLGNNWIATAFTYQAEMPVWLGWIAVVLVAIYLAAYPALAALTAWWLARRWRAAFLPAFAACWIISEWLRSWVFTGFAWNPLGIVTLGGFERPGLAAVAPWTGTYALSAVVVLLAGCWREAVLQFDRGQRGTAVCAALAPLTLFLAPQLLIPAKAVEGTLPFTLVQPDTRQEGLADPRTFEHQFRVTAGLSLPYRPGQRRLVMWPESGVPDYLRPGYAPYWYDDTYAGDPGLARARIGHVVGPGSLLLTGAIDLEQRNRRIVGAWNVVTALDNQGAIHGSYAKAHLVPYGEYLPMRALLEPIGLSRLTAGSLDFFSGPGARTIDFGPLDKGGWGKVGFQICYEIIFSGQVVDPQNRPDMIFNPSNDGWFGSWGPPQHLAQARLRAIEEGLPVLRSTTTGISAVIDSSGIVRAFIPRLRPGRLDGMVPPPAPPTVFSHLGNRLPLGWAAILLLIAMVATRRRAR
jgi:apolipoprotein N-acyltransferase